MVGHHSASRSVHPCKVPGRIEHVEVRRCRFSSTSVKGADISSKNCCWPGTGVRYRHAQCVRLSKRASWSLVSTLQQLRWEGSPVPPRLLPEVGPRRLVGDEPEPSMLQGSCPSGQDIPEARMTSPSIRPGRGIPTSLLPRAPTPEERIFAYPSEMSLLLWVVIYLVRSASPGPW